MSSGGLIIKKNILVVELDTESNVLGIKEDLKGLPLRELQAYYSWLTIAAHRLQHFMEQDFKKRDEELKEKES